MIAVSATFWFIGLFARPLAAFLFVLSTPASVHPWTLATSVYAHAGLGHLLSNALVVVVAGVPVAASTTRTTRTTWSTSTSRSKTRSPTEPADRETVGVRRAKPRDGGRLSKGNP